LQEWVAPKGIKVSIVGSTPGSTAGSECGKTGITNLAVDPIDFLQCAF